MNVILKEILNEVKEMKGSNGIEGINNRLDVMQRDIEELKTDVAELKSDVAALKSDVAELKSDVDVLKSDVAELKSDVDVLKGNVAGLMPLKEAVAALQEDVVGLMPLKDTVAALQKDMADVKKDISILKIDVRANREMLTGMEMRLGERIDGVRNKTAANTQDIRDIKDQIKKQDRINGKWANATLSRLKSV